MSQPVGEESLKEITWNINRIVFFAAATDRPLSLEEFREVGMFCAAGITVIEVLGQGGGDVVEMPVSPGGYARSGGDASLPGVQGDGDSGYSPP